MPWSPSYQEGLGEVCFFESLYSGLTEANPPDPPC